MVDVFIALHWVEWRFVLHKNIPVSIKNCHGILSGGGGVIFRIQPNGPQPKRRGLGLREKPLTKKARPSFRKTAPVICDLEECAYFLHLAHSSHLSLQQVLQAFSLQHPEQAAPAAFKDATANKANAMVVRMDFIIFLSFGFLDWDAQQSRTQRQIKTRLEVVVWEVDRKRFSLIGSQGPIGNFGFEAGERKNRRASPTPGGKEPSHLRSTRTWSICARGGRIRSSTMALANRNERQPRSAARKRPPPS